MKLLRRKRRPQAVLALPPEQQWRIDYARNELVNAADPPRRLPIQPGEPIMGAILRHGVIGGDTGNGIYRRLREDEDA